MLTKAKTKAKAQKSEKITYVTKTCAMCDRPFKTKKITGKWSFLERKLCNLCWGACGGM